jgi:putrescine carbamoyltransferase
MDHPRSIIFDQSENRLHTEKGLLVYFLYPRLKRPSEQQKAFHQGQIGAFLEKVEK